MKHASYFLAALFAIFVVFAVPAAFAQEGDGAATAKVIPIKEAWNLANKAPVAVEGYITKSLGPGKYTLENEGAFIRVKIDKDTWGGEPTGEKDLITVYGTVLKRGNSTEIEVEKVVRK